MTESQRDRGTALAVDEVLHQRENKTLIKYLAEPCRKTDNKIGIIGLNLCLVGSLVSNYRAASVASVDDHVSLFRIGLGSDRAENTAAIVCSVAGIYINVKGTKAERAMISRGIAKRQNLFAAGFADEA